MAVIDITNTFSAAPRSSWDFLQTNGQGCYIPAYQRPYSWDTDNVSRLFEDVINGISQLLQRPSAISFMGTIIAIKDNKYRTVHPLLRPDVPSGVMVIIDGQQRISTFIMINIIFHKMLIDLKEKFSNSEEGEAFSWLHDQCIQLSSTLEETFVLDQRTGKGNNKFYPRMIRAYDDTWSRDPATAIYKSPMAHLIWSYIDYWKSDQKEPFLFSIKNRDGSDNDGYASVSKIFSFIQKEIKNICSNKKETDFPSLTDISLRPNFQNAVWGYELPESVVKFITEESDHRKYAAFTEALRIIILSKYICDRIALTVVTTESEDDAFDMFEALNTTGEPLTAFETFKPKIIDAEGIENYEKSLSREGVLKIEAYLDAFHKAQEKQIATSELLIPFALAETGEKLQKRLNDQRRYLREKFDALPDISQKRDFVHSLASLSSFMKYVWADPAKEIQNLTKASDILICLDMLNQLKHNIVIAPLSRFYDQALRADDAQKVKKFEELGDAILATAAFSILWRGAKGGTENIDNVYRSILKDGVQAEGIDIPALGKHGQKGLGVVSISNYKKALRYHLNKEGYLGSDIWIKAASRCAIYKSAKVVARFILFCASHNAIPDTENPPLIKAGRNGVAPMLTVGVWKDETFLTIEHIAPQTNTDKGWEKRIYDEEAFHRLGNLTLLPQIENNILANRPWNLKKSLYALFSSADTAQFDKIKAGLEKEGFRLSKNSDEYLSKAKYLGICQSLSQYTGDWTYDVIEKRSNRIAELAYPVLKGWLD